MDYRWLLFGRGNGNQFPPQSLFMELQSYEMQTPVLLVLKLNPLLGRIVLVFPHK